MNIELEAFTKKVALALIDLHDFTEKVIVLLSKLKLSDIVHRAVQKGKTK